MMFQHVLFFSLVIACEVLLSFSLRLKAGNFPGAETLNQAKTYGLLQNQMEFPLVTFIHQERNRRDVSSSVEESNEKTSPENSNATQNDKIEPEDAREDARNEDRQKQRVCKDLPLCGRKNGNRKRQTQDLPNNKFKRGIDQVMNLERHRQAQDIDAYIRNVISSKGSNQLKEEVNPTQANCIGWFRRRGGSSTTSSSVDAADEGDGADTGGDADDSNLQTSRRLRARRRTTTRRSRRQN